VTLLQWLHYLVLKLLNSKRIRAPKLASHQAQANKGRGKRKGRLSGASSHSTKEKEQDPLSEESCYSTLIEVEKILEENVKVRSCRTSEGARVRSAGDLWTLANTKGWI
jgi:hypothetical protein